MKWNVEKLESNALEFYFSLWKKCRDWREYLWSKFFFGTPVSLKGCLHVSFCPKWTCFYSAIVSNYWNEFHFPSQDWNEIHFESLKRWHNASFISGRKEISCKHDISFHWILFVFQSRIKMYERSKTSNHQRFLFCWIFGLKLATVCFSCTFFKG